VIWRSGAAPKLNEQYQRHARPDDDEQRHGKDETTCSAIVKRIVIAVQIGHSFSRIRRAEHQSRAAGDMATRLPPFGALPSARAAKCYSQKFLRPTQPPDRLLRVIGLQRTCQAPSSRQSPIYGL
jgi:hypothetical protein